MEPTHVLLIEAVVAVGAHPRDAQVRARALLGAGFDARCATVEALHESARHEPPVPAGDLLRVRADVRGRHALRRWLREAPADLVLVASAIAGGGEAGRWLDRVPGRAAFWWPTGVGAGAAPTPIGAAGARMGSMRRSGPLPILPLAGDGATGLAALRGSGSAGLDAAVLADARVARGQLPLWDGEYVLAPAALSGAPGRALIEAFAALCAGHDGLDLVVLADPQPAFERMARACGIGFRVHFAGEAPRDAEIAWLSAATAVVCAGDAPLSAGLVLRALARGCPLLGAPGAAPVRALEAWLAARGLAIGAASAPLAARLERAATPDALRRARAREAAADHGIEPTARRLAGALHAVLGGRRAA